MRFLPSRPRACPSWRCLLRLALRRSDGRDRRQGQTLAVERASPSDDAIYRQRIGGAEADSELLAPRDLLELGERLIDARRRQIGIEVAIIDRLRQRIFLGESGDS